MKKIFALLIFVLILAPDTFAQTLLNVNKYFPLFSIKEKKDIDDSDYVWEASDDEILKFGILNWNGRENDDTELVDTPLEFALLSYYSQPVLKIRPVQANSILPANNPKLADQKLGAAVFQEIQVLRFLGDTAAVGRHEGVLKFITDRGNVTRAEVEAYYRGGIRALISEVVDEAYRDAQAKSEKKLPNNIIPEIKQMLTSFFLSPNQTDYDTIINYVANRKPSDDREIQRIRQIKVSNHAEELRRRNLEIDVELVTLRIEIILLQSIINLGLETRR